MFGKCFEVVPWVGTLRTFRTLRTLTPFDSTLGHFDLVGARLVEAPAISIVTMSIVRPIEHTIQMSFRFFW